MAEVGSIDRTGYTVNKREGLWSLGVSPCLPGSTKREIKRKCKVSKSSCRAQVRFSLDDNVVVIVLFFEFILGSANEGAIPFE